MVTLRSIQILQNEHSEHEPEEIFQDSEGCNNNLELSVGFIARDRMRQSKVLVAESLTV